MPSPAAGTRPFALTAEQARALAAEFGTPLYVLDEAEFRRLAREYQAHWTLGEVSYASKANSGVAVLRWAVEEGLGVDAASIGELEAARRACAQPERCRLHGNYKPAAEIAFAMSRGVGEVVADSLSEVEALARAGWKSKVVLRVAPDVDAGSGAKISTSRADTKFGLSIVRGDALEAVRRCLALRLDLRGYHCHVGSMMPGPEAVVQAAHALALFAEEARKATGFRAASVNLGGGLGIAYTAGPSPMSPAEYCDTLETQVRGALEGYEVEIEPGRSIAGPAGVTLYTVGVVKRSTSGTRHVVVDGGMSDNPRPALYGAAYTVLSDAPGEPEPATVSGRHCETDLLFPDVPLPSGLAEGDVLQVLCTGAYNASMASNYNRFLRPATVALGLDGNARVVERRETLDDLFAREDGDAA